MPVKRVQTLPSFDFSLALSDATTATPSPKTLQQVVLVGQIIYLLKIQMFSMWVTGFGCYFLEKSHYPNRMTVHHYPIVTLQATPSSGEPSAKNTRGVSRMQVTSEEVKEQISQMTKPSDLPYDERKRQYSALRRVPQLIPFETSLICFFDVRLVPIVYMVFFPSSLF